MLKLKALFDSDPYYVPNVHFSHEVRRFQDPTQRMEQALVCAEMIAEKGLNVEINGDVTTNEPSEPIVLYPGQSILIDLDEVSVPQENLINSKRQLYAEMHRIISEIRRQEAEITPHKSSLSFTELGFEAKTEEQLQAVTEWLSERMTDKPRPHKP